MISIIICSINKEFFNNLKKNIISTIGDIEFEIIKIDNSIEKLSLAKAYNKGGDSAKFEYLLFIHEDIEFETKNWGQILVSELNIKNVGVIGLAGSDYVPNVPTSWAFDNKYYFVYIIQSNKDRTLNEIIININETKKVFALDGVFMAVKKNIFMENKFNEDFLGFHGYDISFSLNIAKKHDNYVTNKILIKHFSKGNYSKEWLKELIKIRQLYGSNFTNYIDKTSEYNAYHNFLKVLSSFDFSYKEKLFYSIKFLSLKKQGLKKWLYSLNKIKYLLFRICIIILLFLDFIIF